MQRVAADEREGEREIRVDAETEGRRRRRREEDGWKKIQKYSV